MNVLRLIRAILVGAMISIYPAMVTANDLNDGISSYTDDRISDEDQLGSEDVNFTFIEVRAKAQAAVMTSSSRLSFSGDHSGVVDSSLNGASNGNINSVVLYPGTSVYGDIVIIDNSTGNKTQVVFGDAYSSSVGSDLDIDSAEKDLSDLVH